MTVISTLSEIENSNVQVIDNSILNVRQETVDTISIKHPLVVSIFNPNAVPFLPESKKSKADYLVSQVTSSPTHRVHNLSTSHISDQSYIDSEDGECNSTSVMIENDPSVLGSISQNVRDEVINLCNINHTSGGIEHDTVGPNSLSNKSKSSTADAIRNLNNIRIKYVNNVIIGHLNINSLSKKIEALSYIIKDKIDILVIGETKLDNTFTKKQFIIEGFKKPYGQIEITMVEVL